jgi:hypothetical protein
LGEDAEQLLAAKLKAKQQWDRFLELKSEPKVKVGVRPVGSSQDNDGGSGGWLEVGWVRSRSPLASTPVAVARQRALIAEVR